MKRICGISLKYNKKTKLRPAVGISLSKDFNVIAVDMKEIDKTYILHVIDHATCCHSGKKQEKRKIFQRQLFNHDLVMVTWFHWMFS